MHCRLRMCQRLGPPVTSTTLATGWLSGRFAPKPWAQRALNWQPCGGNTFSKPYFTVACTPVVIRRKVRLVRFCRTLFAKIIHSFLAMCTTHRLVSHWMCEALGPSQPHKWLGCMPATGNGRKRQHDLEHRLLAAAGAFRCHRRFICGRKRFHGIEVAFV